VPLNAAILVLSATCASTMIFVTPRGTVGRGERKIEPPDEQGLM